MTAHEPAVELKKPAPASADVPVVEMKPAPATADMPVVELKPVTVSALVSVVELKLNPVTAHDQESIMINAQNDRVIIVKGTMQAVLTL